MPQVKDPLCGDSKLSFDLRARLYSDWLWGIPHEWGMTGRSPDEFLAVEANRLVALWDRYRDDHTAEQLRETLTRVYGSRALVLSILDAG